MNKFDFKKYRSGIITIEVQSLKPEKFVNLMWKNGVYIKNIKKLNIATLIMDINLNDYSRIEEIAKKTDSKIKIIGRRGISFLIIKVKKRIALAAGVLLFAAVIYYLSTFIWGIDISVDHNISPYEIRQQLRSFGIEPGINKKRLNVYEIEEKLIKNNDNIMWVRARIEGSKLKITAAERQSPPNIINEDTPCNLVARKDGEVIRVYTKAGTPVVKKGDMIRKGQILVKGEQGKEGSIYQVHAVGDVICRTFYEEVEQVQIDSVKKERTGNKLENIYISVRGENLYLKKSANNFAKYDKIEDNLFFVKKDTYYEIKETKVHGDVKKIVDDTSKRLYEKICANLDKSVKIIDKIVNYEADNAYTVRVLVVSEENVASPEKIAEQNNQ